MRILHNSIQALLIAALLWMLPAGEVLAQNVPDNLLNNCTQSNFFNYDNNPVNQAQDMLQTVVDQINTAVQGAYVRLYLAFINDGGYQNAIYAAFLLTVIFFAVSFMFGFITLTLAQGAVRIAKIGFIIWIIGPTGLQFMDEYVVRFFNQGGAWLINAMINVATTGSVGTPSTSVSAPFTVLDEIIRVVFSPRMFVTIIAAATTAPFGPLVALALIWSVFSIFMALLRALQIYAISIIIKAVLMGLAPVFLPMMLFDRTKQMFTGWLNQLINFTLQPILLFAFLAFFATLLASAARDILPPDEVHVCYVRADNQAATPFDVHSWRFMCCNEGGGNCTPYEGKWTWQGGVECPNGAVFPVNHINILVFLLLTHIMVQLTSIATAIASELAQGGLDLSKQPNALNSWFGSMGSRNATPTTPTPRARR
jgi:hypothetical protein